MATASSLRWQVPVAAAVTFGAVAAAGLWWRRRRSQGVRISGIYVHPIKACQAIQVAEAELLPEGLRHDREYMVVQVREGKPEFVSQRTFPQMALIVPEMPTADGRLTVRKEGMETLEVRPGATGGGAKFRVDVFETAGDGEDVGDAAAAWLCRAIGAADLRLLRFAGGRVSEEAFGPGVVRFADGFSLLLTSEASMAELGRRSGLQHIRARIRPNLVVSGCGSHAEDTWRAVRWTGRGGASAEVKLVKPCGRCEVPAVDPSKGIRGTDPLKTMKPYRSGSVLMNAETHHKAHYGRNKGEIFFGQNGIPAVVQGRVVLRVGDSLVVTTDH